MINDRPVVGGNNSSEIRVHLGGVSKKELIRNLAVCRKKFGPEKGGNAQPAEYYEDQKKMDWLAGEKNVSLFLNYRAIGVTKEEIINEAKTFENIPVDVVEWRVDWFEHVFEFEKVEEVLKELREALGETPLLFTFRTSKEGGEKAIEAKEYAELNKKAAATGYVDLVDVEAFTGDEVVKEIIEAAHEVNVKVVASNHDFEQDT